MGYCCSVAKSCLPLCNPMDYSTPDFPVLHYPQSLLRLMSIESVMPSNHLILCRPLQGCPSGVLLPPSIFPRTRVFSNESALHFRWPKYWSFSVSISPSNEYSRLISFRIDWFDLFAVHHLLDPWVVTDMFSAWHLTMSHHLLYSPLYITEPRPMTISIQSAPYTAKGRGLRFPNADPQAELVSFPNSHDWQYITSNLIRLWKQKN